MITEQRVTVKAAEVVVFVNQKNGWMSWTGVGADESGTSEVSENRRPLET